MQVAAVAIATAAATAAAVVAVAAAIAWPKPAGISVSEHLGGRPEALQIGSETHAGQDKFKSKSTRRVAIRQRINHTTAT